MLTAVGAGLAAFAFVTDAGPARAEGFFDVIRNAVFGRVSEVQPAYAALPRDPQRDRRHGGFRPLRNDSSFSDGAYTPRLPRDWDSSAEPLRRNAFRPRATHRNMTPIREARIGSSGSRTMCVRLCDGYVFPGTRLRASGQQSQIDTCNASCPGAPTALYRLSGGASTSNPGKAVSTADGSLYQSLTTAFLFRKERVAQCSCQGPDNIAARVPIQDDSTLRKGDVVVGEKGDATVFAGTSEGRKTFGDFRTSDVIGKSTRRQIDKVMGVSQREAMARAFEKTLKVGALVRDEAPGPAVAVTGSDGRQREAALKPVAAPAGSGGNVRAFTVMTPAGSGGGIRTVGPAVYVIR